MRRGYSTCGSAVWRGLRILFVAAGMATSARAQEQGCNVTAVQRPIRAEGYTELIGDIVITCTGRPLGAPSGSSSIGLTLNADVTSRTYAGGWSDALLIVDDPTPGSLRTCSDPIDLCTSANINVFPGRVSGKSVLFGPVSFRDGVQRSFRITNVRVNANALSLGQSVDAGVFIFGIAVGQGVQAGITRTGLAFSVLTDGIGFAGTAFAPCTASGRQLVGLLRFAEAEGFASAFKPRTVAPYLGPDASPLPVAQDMPGVTWESESSFYAPELTSPLVDFKTVGLAAAGTRLRASITGIPAGARVWVSTLPIVSSVGRPIDDIPPVARLISSGFQPFAPLGPTDLLDNGIAAAELTVTGGRATAVWEVLRATPGVNDTLEFMVWVQPGNSSSFSPLQVTGGFDPAYAQPDATQDDVSLPWPRFALSSDTQASPVFLGCIPTVVALAVNPKVIAVGASFAVTATVIAVAGQGPPTGNLTFAESGTAVANANVGSAGQGSITVSPTAVGQLCYTANYSGDARFAASVSGTLCVTVGKGNVTLTNFQSTAGLLYPYGPSTDLSVDVTPHSPTPQYSPKIVRFTADGVVLRDVDVTPDGRATLSGIVFPPGEHSIDVRFLGDANWAVNPLVTPSAQIARARIQPGLRLSIVVTPAP